MSSRAQHNIFGGAAIFTKPAIRTGKKVGNQTGLSLHVA
jgi:hypothetical protein